MNDNFDSVRIEKIENGYIVYVYTKDTSDKAERWDTNSVEYYAPDFDAALVTVKEKS